MVDQHDYFVAFEGLQNFHPKKNLSHQSWFVGVPKAYKTSRARSTTLK